MKPPSRGRVVLAVTTTAAGAIAVAAAVSLVLAAVLTLATERSLRGFPEDPLGAGDIAVKPQVLARDGTPLNFTLENRWNTDVVPLSSVPALLQRAFIEAEDRHFYEHHGVDWPARFAAAWQNLLALSAVRGAGSITEQVVRLIHPRPRTIWSHWIEGFEAASLERRVSKAQILAFYLNQVPYAGRRRGVVQAARMYFDRSLDTLSPAEQLSLAVLVRSPQGMDLRRNAPRAQRAMQRLADRLMQAGYLSAIQREEVRTDPVPLRSPEDVLDAGHFVSHVLDESVSGGQPPPARIRTTLDPHFQLLTQQILDSGLSAIAKRRVHDGAVLVIDTQRNEIEAWVVGNVHGSAGPIEPEPNGYDTVMTPRQPGSTMKPLLYALALERGWTAATLIDDSELSESVGGGQHTFHNYSHVHYAR
jgi:penicillin-binding protein 1C